MGADKESAPGQGGPSRANSKNASQRANPTAPAAPKASAVRGATRKVGPGEASARTKQFLAALFGLEMERAYVTAFPEDPAGAYPPAVRGRMWRGGTYAALKSRLKDDYNQYVAVSTFKPSADPKDHGQPRRVVPLFERQYAVMIDDIGTKVSEDSIKLPLTAEVETSPGNRQGWYALKPDDPDAANEPLLKHVVNEMIHLGLAQDSTDPGMKGVNRYGRLPGGVNNKAKLGEPFSVKLLSLVEARKYTVAEIAAAYGIDLEAKKAAPKMNGAVVPRAKPDEGEAAEFTEAILDALTDAGLGPHEHPNKPGGYDVTCPWADTHTGGDDSGSMFFAPGYVDPASGTVLPNGGYKCHHGHCEKRGLRDVVAWLNKEHGAGLRMLGAAPVLFTPETGLIELDRQLPAEVLKKMDGNARTGALRPTANNLTYILENDPAYARRWRFEYDAFKDRTYFDFGGVTHGDYAGRYARNDVLKTIQKDICRQHGIEFRPDTINFDLSALLYARTFDSAQQWAQQRIGEWDGVKRLDRWLIEFAGVVDKPYVRAVSELMILAAAKRMLAPGFKFDTMLILQGQQGVGKSRLIKALCPVPAWFMETHVDMADTKETVSQLAGKIIVEIPEVHSIKYAQTATAVKSFLSRTEDRTRLPYERGAVDFQRRVVFFGTTNEDDYLRDPTGARRFWPVEVSDSGIDVNGLLAVRDQLWAEACTRAAEITDIEQLELPKALWYAAKIEQRKRSAIEHGGVATAVDRAIQAGIARIQCNDPSRIAVNLEDLTTYLQGQNVKLDSGGPLNINAVRDVLKARGMRMYQVHWRKGEPKRRGWAEPDILGTDTEEE